MYKQGMTPWNYIKFLEYCKQLTFLKAMAMLFAMIGFRSIFVNNRLQNLCSQRLLVKAERREPEPNLDTRAT